MNYLDKSQIADVEAVISERHAKIIEDCERKANQWRDLTDEGRFIKVLEAQLRKHIIDTINATAHLKTIIDRQNRDITSFMKALSEIDTSIDDFCLQTKRPSRLANTMIQNISKAYVDVYSTLTHYSLDRDDEEEDFSYECGARKEKYYDPDYDIYSSLEKYRERSEYGALLAKDRKNE